MALGTSKDRDFVEVFSGRGEISRALRDVTWEADFEQVVNPTFEEIEVTTFKNMIHHTE